jgi:hypothetical protein
MINSRVSLAIITIGFALASGLPKTVAGQTPAPLSQAGAITPTIALGAGPVLLRPRRRVNPVPEALQTKHVQNKPAIVTSTPDALGPAAPTGGGGWAPVDVQMLQAVDNDSVGVIDDADGGLGVDMWGRADRALVAQAIAMLPRNTASPAMRDLMRRLLLTRAMAPARTTPGPSLLSLRINALFDLGELGSAMALMSRAPIASTEEQLLLTEVESRFFQQDTAGACGKVRAAAQEFKAAYWQQAMAYCMALAGKIAEASLMSDIIAERSTSVHPAFFAAMDRLSGSPPPAIDSLLDPSALYLSMMRTASIALPLDVTTKATAAVIKAIALSPNAPLDLRLAAAERAAERGILVSNTLVAIYSAVPFETSVLEAPLKQAEAEWAGRGRALLIRAAARRNVPAARAEVLQAGFKIARAKGGSRILAVASQSMLKVMNPISELAWFAGTAARTLIAVGEFDHARKWIELDLRTARENSGENALPQDIWPLAILIGAEGSGEVSAMALQSWWRSQNQEDAAAKIDAGRVLFSLLDAFDVAVPASLWAPILGAPPVQGQRSPRPGIQSALRRAVAAGHKGEVVALSLLALGDAGPTTNNLHAVNLSVRALSKIGLTMEAQRIALEAAVAAGL